MRRLANVSTQKSRQTDIGGRQTSYLQSEPLIPFRVRRAVGLRRAARLPLCCHLHINGSAKQALLPLDFGTGNWWGNEANDETYY